MNKIEIDTTHIKHSLVIKNNTIKEEIREVVMTGNKLYHLKESVFKYKLLFKYILFFVITPVVR